MARSVVLQQAVELEPENALAWARLAELQLSFSRLDEALEAAQRAVAIDPNLSRTQTILGFAYLTRVDTGGRKNRHSKERSSWIRPTACRDWVWGWQKFVKAIC